MRRPFLAVLVAFMLVAFVVQTVAGYPAISFGCGILFGGCFTMLYTSYMMKRLIRHELDAKSDT